MQNVDSDINNFKIVIKFNKKKGIETEYNGIFSDILYGHLYSLDALLKHKDCNISIDDLIKSYKESSNTFTIEEIHKEESSK